MNVGRGARRGVGPRREAVRDPFCREPSVVKLDELDYDLPEELIAQVPSEPRDSSRLLVATGAAQRLRLADRRFRDLPALLDSGDVLVRNDTRVIPARAHFHKPTGGRVELLFVERLGYGAVGGARARADAAVRGAACDAAPAPSPDTWEVLARGRLRGGELLRSEAAPEAFAVEVGERLGEGRFRVRPAAGVAVPLAHLLALYGETPLPPYIKTPLDDPERYQTVYARLRGSAAAPTAGLHFTAPLDEALRAAGVTIEHLTLHVGLATFKPVTVERVEDHPLHEEPFVVDRAVWERIATARAAGRRVVAVGTTMVRLLEELGRRAAGPVSNIAEPDWSVAEPDRSVAEPDRARPGVLEGRTRLFITPAYEFRTVDGLITNFHLPRTSLLALVMALCGVDETRRIYAHAIAQRYRFYSFGDAMLAWRGEEASP
jgi:S-adenosylmethionine:tRNA ribosyltransferase-isomerase